MWCNFSSGVYAICYILINALYLSIIARSLQKIKWSEIDKRLFARTLFYIVFYSFLLTCVINWFFHWNAPRILFFINTFLWVIGLVSFVIYLYQYRTSGWSPIALTIILTLIPILILFSTTCFNPILFGQDELDEEDIYSLDYIDSNTTCVVYVDDPEWFFSHGTYNYKRDIIIFVINNGSENIDKSLQINIEYTSNKNFSFIKPNGNQNISYFSESVKPWIFGDNTSMSIRWNDSFAGSTLPKRDSRWAIIKFYSEEWLHCHEFEVLNISVLIDDEKNINIKKMPCFVDKPDGNPKEWLIDEVLNKSRYYY